MKHSKTGIVVGLIFVLAVPVLAHASGSGMPWETPLQNILNSMSGTVAKVLGVLAIIITGIGLAFGESGGLLKKILSIVFGLSIAFSAATFGLPFFGFTGGCAF